MTTFLMMIACGKSEPAPTDSDTDTDTDTDSDTDSDTDTDTDSDTDSDADTDTGLVCVGEPSELEVYLEVRDDVGTCTACNPGRIDFYAGIRNPCPIDIEVDVVLDCFIMSFSLAYPTGDGVAAATDCPPVGSPDTLTIPAGGVYEELYYNETLRDPGNYDASVDLRTLPTEQSASLTFQIL